MLRKLREDVFLFSGLKTHAQLTEASALLLNADGTVRSFTDFARDFQKISAAYNIKYLEAEYNFAISSAQMASKWHDAQANKDRIYLQYRTAADEKVRESHAALHNTTLPVDSEFWKYYYAPNGWNCRCTVVEVLREAYDKSDEQRAMAAGEKATTAIGKSGKNTLEIFRFNPGIDQVIFPPQHPYSKVSGAERAKKTIRQLKDNDKIAMYNKLSKNDNYTDVVYDANTGGMKATHTLHSFHPERGHYEKEVRDLLYTQGNTIILEQEIYKKVQDGVKHIDGLLNGLKYEQSTIIGTGNNTIKNALYHAKSKGAEVAILYFPDAAKFDKELLEKGIAKYEGVNKYRFKQIIYIVGDMVYEV